MQFMVWVSIALSLVSLGIAGYCWWIVRQAKEIDRRLESERLAKKRQLRDAGRKYPARPGAIPAKVRKARFSDPMLKNEE